MTARVPRHEVSGGDPERFVSMLAEDSVETIEDLESAPQMIDAALSETLMLARARCLLDPRAQYLETWEAYVAAMQVSSALFASAAATEGSVESRINHKMRTIPAVGPHPHANAGTWLTAFWLSVICRDRSRTDQLCSISLDQLRASGAEFDSYIYSWVDSLQSYWTLQPGLVDKLVTTIDSSYPEVAQIAGRELMNKILYQPINLFHRYLREDHDGFNEVLAQALQLHKEYWTATAERAKDPDGWVALGPLAVACLAYDADFPIDVESDYLPRHLLERSWYGEFPT